MVVVANAAIGIVQEVRAKRTLDRLAVLNAPRARVVRDGAEREVAVADVVLDDLLVLRAGDQVPPTASCVEADGLEVDESLLTGEADAGRQARRATTVLVRQPSWSPGTGRFQATAVGGGRLRRPARRPRRAGSPRRTPSWSPAPTSCCAGSR